MAWAWQKITKIIADKQANERAWKTKKNCAENIHLSSCASIWIMRCYGISIVCCFYAVIYVYVVSWLSSVFRTYRSGNKHPVPMELRSYAHKITCNRFMGNGRQTRWYRRSFIRPPSPRHRCCCSLSNTHILQARSHERPRRHRTYRERVIIVAVQHTASLNPLYIFT